MTDQPETELEYHFKKLSRTMVFGTLVVTSALFLVAAVVTVENAPTIALAFALSAGTLDVLALAGIEDGWARRIVNQIPGDSIEELQRPNEQSHEVPADD